ncbi:hypothetical protein N7450_010666 [Penicillium hetheringtonii]|nr:hypothetical protein N7450_010666 [Penicillium hetheringtonii]
MQSNASPLARSISLNSETRGQEQDTSLPDSRSAGDVDVDTRWEESRRYINDPARPMTSGQITTTIEANGSEQDDSHKKTIRNFGRKLMGGRK